VRIAGPLDLAHDLVQVTRGYALAAVEGDVGRAGFVHGGSLGSGRSPYFTRVYLKLPGFNQRPFKTKPQKTK
jgi:hypothetical protein